MASPALTCLALPSHSFFCLATPSLA
jgi:hypothetical protein